MGILVPEMFCVLYVYVSSALMVIGLCPFRGVVYNAHFTLEQCELRIFTS